MTLKTIGVWETHTGNSSCFQGTARVYQIRLTSSGRSLLTSYSFTLVFLTLNRPFNIVSNVNVYLVVGEGLMFYDMFQLQTVFTKTLF